MRKIAFSLLLFSSLTANEEMQSVDALIQATEENLIHEKELKGLLHTYLSLQQEALKNPDDNALLLKVARAACPLLRVIQQNYYSYLFSHDFMKELTLFAQVGQKAGVIPP